MKIKFKKISITKELHDQLKKDRDFFNLKSINDTIKFYYDKWINKK